MVTRGLIFRQMFENVSSTYTYLLACASTKEAVIIDPVLETVARDLNIIEQLRLKLIYAANTHVHADHVTGSGEIKRKIPGVRSVLGSLAAPAKADLLLKHGEKLKFGKQELEIRNTPGHTNSCVTYVLHSERMAFTGDALLIRGCGRTDFQQGDAGRLYDSVHQQIFSLPKDYLLFPAHDYKGLQTTSVQEETEFNARLTKTKAEFIAIMKNLNLAYPKQIDRAVPANMQCGISDNITVKVENK